MLDRYNVSKLLDLFLVREIAKLPLAKDVVVDVVNPGMCVSDLRDDLPWPVPFVPYHAFSALGVLFTHTGLG